MEVTALGGIDVTRTWQLSGTHLRTPEGQHCLRFLAFHASLLQVLARRRAQRMP